MRRLLSLFITFYVTFFIGNAQNIEQTLPLPLTKSATVKSVYWNLDSMLGYRYYDGTPYLLLKYVTNQKNTYGQSTNYLSYGRTDTSQNLAKWDSLNVIYDKVTVIERNKFPFVIDHWGDTSYCSKMDTEGKQLFYLYHSFDHSSYTWGSGYKKYYSYTESGLLDQILKYETYSTVWFKSEKTSYFYNDTLLDYQISYNWDSGTETWKASSKKSYKYYFIPDANTYVVDTIISYTLPSTSPVWQYSTLEKFIYSLSLKVVEYYQQSWDADLYDWVNKQKKIYDYDSQDRLIGLTYYNYDTASNTWYPTYKYTYVYTADGQIDSSVKYNWFNNAWVPYSYTKHIYDNNGIETQRKYYQFDSQTSTWEPFSKYEFYYSQYTYSTADQIIPDYLQISPNPTTGIIKLQNITGPGTLQVLNLTGQTVYSRKTANGSTIDLTHLPANVYLIKFVQTNGKTYIGKFIKL